jgi:hypothetical protein
MIRQQNQKFIGTRTTMLVPRPGAAPGTEITAHPLQRRVALKCLRKLGERVMNLATWRRIIRLAKSSLLCPLKTTFGFPTA